MNEDDASVLELVRIQALTYRYGRAVDAPDYELLSNCFTEDAIFEVGLPGVYDKRLVGYPEIEAHVRTLHTAFSNHRHLVTNHLYGVEGDVGSGESAFTAHHWNEGRLTVSVGGVYQDELRKVDGSWRIARRLVIIDWKSGDESGYQSMRSPD